MFICILLSGRVKSYKYFDALINRIKDKHTVHLFVSVNDELDETTTLFYSEFAEKFKDFLKVIKVQKYTIPEGFINTSIGTSMSGKLFNTLSCYYNDKMAFLEAEKYSNEHNIDYEVYVRFRSDIIVENFPCFNNFNKNILYCVIPPSFFQLSVSDNPDGEYKNGRYYYYGNKEKHLGRFVTSDLAYGSKDLMRIYCKCYDYIIEQNIKNNGNYFICGEYNITCYLHDVNVDWCFFQLPYQYDTDRFIAQK